MSELFKNASLNQTAHQPLADRLRPKVLEDVIGQDHLLGNSGPIGRMIRSGKLSSMILWGPSGSGKTTIARLLAKQIRGEFYQISAVFSGVSDLKKIFNQAKTLRDDGISTILFVDEIHRFNRTQQDIFLPYIEDGTIILIGATTENPSFELNSPLLSRARVLVLNRLSDDALEKLLKRAEKEKSQDLPLDTSARAAIKAMADGDGRYLLNIVEEILNSNDSEIFDEKALASFTNKRFATYDKSRDGHYNLISALHKSVRGSDPDASLYWLARMLVAGEDPLYIARRLIRIASEDVGLADPNALIHTLASRDAYNILGSPEGELAIAQSVVYLAVSPKSNATYSAYSLALEDANDTGSLPPPMHALNAPTQLMKDQGYSRDYRYDHDYDNSFAGQNYFPEGIDRRKYFIPKGQGREMQISRLLSKWEKIRKRAYEDDK